jgi:hypothetical protein
MHRHLRAIVTAVVLLAVLGAFTVVCVSQSGWWCRHAMPPKYEQLKTVAAGVLAEGATYWQHEDNCVPSHYLTVAFKVGNMTGPETWAVFQHHGWTRKDNIGIVSPDGRYGMEYGSTHRANGAGPAFTYVTLSYKCCSSYHSWRWLVP